MSDRTSPRRQAQDTAARIARAIHPMLPETDRATHLADLAKVLPGRAGESARRAAVCYQEAANATDPGVASAMRLAGDRSARLVLSPR